MTHTRASSTLVAPTSPAPDRSQGGNGDPWGLKANDLRTDVAKLREEVERLIEAEELRVFIYPTQTQPSVAPPASTQLTTQ